MQNEIYHKIPANDNYQTEIKLMDIFRILYRRKYLVIFSILISLVLTGLFTFFSTPIYESFTLIKKERTDKDNSSDQLKKIIQFQSLDEVETEIEILKTRTVLDKVVNDLGLFCEIGRVVQSNGTTQEFRMPLAEYHQSISEMNEIALPRLRILEFKPLAGFNSGDFYLKITNDSTVIFAGVNDTVLSTGTGDITSIEIKSAWLHLALDWPGAASGNVIFFRLENVNRTCEKLLKNITVTALRNTSVFKVAVRSVSPLRAQVIANKITEKYRETRLEQKRETVRYSYDFVDRQLEETSKKLKIAEAELSDFKSKNQILMIDETSRKIIGYLSTLDAEKNTTELELAEYRNRYYSLKSELKDKAYFDQTYLTPNEKDRNNSPFSSLLQQLSNAELERLELLQKRTEKHPDVVAVNQRISEIKEKLASYNQNTITAYEIILQSLENKQRNLQGLIRQYARKVERLPENEARLVYLIREKDIHEKMFTLLLDKREELRMAELSKLQDIVVVDPAIRPAKSILPRKRLNVIIGFFVGMILGIVLAFFTEFQSKTIQTVDEIEQGFQLPVLAILPEYNKELKKQIARGFNIANHLGIFIDSRHGFLESYRVMRTKLSQINPDRKMIMFTSCEENSGKTTILSNFAITLALTGKKVMIIDCDLKKPKIGEFFQVPSTSVGLIKFLRNGQSKITVYQLRYQFNDKKVKIDMLPAGGYIESSSELLDKPKFRAFLKKITPIYDYVFIDTPPVTRTVDSLVLGSFVKDVILIVRPNLTYRKSLERALREFNQAGVQIVGCVINGYNLDALEYSYGYGYGYGYGDHKNSFPVTSDEVVPQE